MVTLFSIPKPFAGRIAVLQENAIQSWTRVHPDVQVVLLGDVEGAEAAARRLGVEHRSGLKTTELGTPLLSSAFELAGITARHDVLTYVNADIIIVGGLLEAIARVDAGSADFLLCGRRWDLDVTRRLSFDVPNWAEAIWAEARKAGKLHSASGLDYFTFRRGSIRLKDFAVGRPGWDGWVIYDARFRGMRVVDCTNYIRIVHQNHDYSHSPFGQRARVTGPEHVANMRLAGGYVNQMTLREADWELSETGAMNKTVARRLYGPLSMWYPWRQAVAWKRQLLELIED